MNKAEIKQQHKNEALNKIIKRFHPKTENRYDNPSWNNDSYSDQDIYFVQGVLNDLEKKINKIK